VALVSIKSPNAFAVILNRFCHDLAATRCPYGANEKRQRPQKVSKVPLGRLDNLQVLGHPRANRQKHQIESEAAIKFRVCGLRARNA